MLYLTCTTITSVDLAHYEVYRAKDWVSVNCGAIHIIIDLCTWTYLFQIMCMCTLSYLFQIVDLST